MFLKIKPFDTLFFRDAKPFNMGSDTWAEYLFPPLPSTLYGAIRSFLIFYYGSLQKFLTEEMPEQKWIGTKDHKGELKVKGPFIYNGQPLFSIPADLVKVEEKKKYKLKRTEICKSKSVFISDYALEQYLVFKPQLKTKYSFGYIDDISLKDYLERKKEEFYCIENLFADELKIGIKREKTTKTSEESHLYRLSMIRLKENVSFLIEIENRDLELPETGIFQLGGEGKTIEFEKIRDNPVKEIENINFNLKGGIFKLYFATPTIFEKGWLPSWIDETTMEGEYQGIKLKLVNIALKKYKLIGGWNLAENRPKKMHKAVAEGSVYYFKVLDNTNEEKIKNVFHFKHVIDEFPEVEENDKFLSKEGFGLSFVGGL